MQLRCMGSSEVPGRIQMHNTGEGHEWTPVFKALKWTFRDLIYKEFIFFTDNDVYKFLIWVCKLHVPKINKTMSKLL